MKRVLKVLMEYSYLGEVMRNRFKEIGRIPDNMKKFAGITELLSQWR
jgi:hypothetical protein